MKVFISHSSKDRDFAERLAKYLEEKHEISAWVCFDDLKGGDNWPEAINAEIENCDKAILLISKSSVVSDHVENEIALASTHKKPVIPVNLDRSTLSGTLAYYLQKTHQIIVSGMAEQEFFSRIVNAVNSESSLPAAPPENPLPSAGENSTKSQPGRFWSVMAKLAIVLSVVGGALALFQYFGPDKAPEPDPGPLPPVMETIPLTGGGTVRVIMEPNVEVGQTGELVLETDRAVYLQVQHIGAGSKLEQSHNGLLAAHKRIRLPFLANPPAGMNLFIIYASPVALKTNPKNPDTVVLSRGPAKIIKELVPEPISGPGTVIQHTTVPYRSFVK